MRVLNVLGGLVLLPLFIVRLLLWPILIGTTVVVVTHFIIKCW